MAALSDSIPVLIFCNDCGSLRLRDVTKQLQELFTKKSMKPAVCGICNRLVENGSLIKLNSNNSTEQVNQTSKENEGRGIGSYGLEVIKIVKDEPVQEDLLEDCQLQLDVSDHDDGGGGGFEDGDSDSVDNPSMDYVDIELRPKVVESPQKRTSVTRKITTKSTPRARAAAKRTGVTAKSIVTKRSGVGAKTRSKLAATRASKMKKEVSDAGADSFQSKRRTRLRTGVIQAANYQPLLGEDKLDEEEMDDDDADEEDLEWKEHDDEEEKDEMEEEKMEGASDDGLYRGKIVGADDDIDISKYIVKNDANSASTSNESQPADEDYLNNWGVDILDPALQEFTATADDPKKLFKCKLCGDDFKYASQFVTHLEFYHVDAVKVDKPFVCRKCGAKFPKIKSLSKHMYRHKNEFVTYSCIHENCNFTFDRKDKLISHIQVHQGKKKYQCKECGIGFKTQKTLLVHRTLHTNQSVPCPHCEKTFRHQVYLQTHLLWHKNGHKFKCDSCSYSSDRIRYVKRHKRQVHEKKAQDLECERCKHTFKSMSGLKVHQSLSQKCNQSKDPNQQNEKGSKLSLLAEDRPYSCNQQGCSKTFRTEDGLQSHIATHEKKFVCTQCGLRTATESYLKWHHKVVHLKIKPYICDHCGKAFGKKSKRDAHVNRIHLKLRPHLCATCGNAFAEERDLKAHMIYHTGEKPYSCDQCDYRCVRSDYLRKHKQRKHTGENPYSCDQCEYQCVRPDYLSGHKKRMHSVKPYPCTLCDKAFASRSRLAAHEKTHRDDGRSGVSSDVEDGFLVSSNTVLFNLHMHDEERTVYRSDQSESKVAIQFL